MPSLVEHIIEKTPIKNRWILVPVCIFLFLFILEIILILRFNNGHFVYTLDDAYIHLSLAENIAQGTYGVNLGEPSAPASSIIWPFILVPFSKFPFAYLVPLIINLFSAIGTIIICSKIILLIFEKLLSRKLLPFCILISVLVIPAFNLIALAFTGMENSLQVFMTSLLLFGLFQIAGNKKPGWWFYLAIIIAPLVRFENLALSIPALIFTFKLNRRASILSAILIIIPIVGFSLFLHSLGLGILPSSILVKSDTVLSAGQPISILGNLLRNIALHRQGLVLLLLLFWLFYISFRFKIAAGERIITRTALCAVILHLLFGKIEYDNRYEIYSWISILLTLLYLHRVSITRLVETKPAYQYVLFFCFFAGLTCTPYIVSIYETPLASNNIYCQHYQMRRFVTEYYPVNVAVNDIGLVSYQNDNYVLDLWGLASRKAFFHRLKKDDPNWIEILCSEHDVKFAMIYDRWFPSLPKNWIPVAELVIRRKKISPAFSKVTFYAVGEDSRTAVMPWLTEFKKNLPDGIRFTIFAGPHPSGSF